MKNKIYYLLINVTTAMKKLGITTADLARLIGVDPRSVARWYTKERTPNELNQYRLNWFVYLVLDRNVSLADIR